MTDAEKREAARQFIIKWKGKGYEKGETQSYWIDILAKILGESNPTDIIIFEKEVIVDGQIKFIDGYIPETRTIIEQKSLGKDLSLKIKQSGGIGLTPYEQAKRYNDNLPYDEKARYIVTCNFSEIWVYDMNTSIPEKSVQKINIDNLQSEFYRLNFLIKNDAIKITKEVEVSLQAGELVGVLYDELYKSYVEPNDETLKSLNKLCVRLVFCMYAEDAGLFGKKDMFHDYLINVEPKKMRRSIKDLFRILNTPEDERDADEDEDLIQFPYVNGGLFDDEDILIPQFSSELKEILLEKASNDFDWSEISPTIFGAIFESTLNPETRRSGGMHYTSVENIHKVIDPLFLDSLKEEFEGCKLKTVAGGWRTKSLKKLQEKISSLNFLDPACGSGNFLTETYLSLRKLENQILKELKSEVASGQMMLDFVEANDVNDLLNIKVSIQQFYGIEVNDFAVTVAKTALWIAEAQMMKETMSITDINNQFLPLKSYVNIIEGNALDCNWNNVLSSEDCNYIMGNPPFVGYSLQTKRQKQDIINVYKDEKGETYNFAGKIDYVAGWYYKASEYIKGSKIKVAFVSTNSITQGEQVAYVWKPLYDLFKIHIDFAYKSFVWNSEANNKANVHCIIVGFSSTKEEIKRILYYSEHKKEVKNINAYLVEAPTVLVEKRSNPICDVPKMVYGNKPTDGGYLFLSQEDYQFLSENEPKSLKYVRQIYGATEYINNKTRYCLWLVNASPSDIKKSKFIMDRIEKVHRFRLDSRKVSTQKSAETPMLFQEIRQPQSEYIIIPRHSSENRSYIPFGFVSPEIIVNDAVQIIPNANIYIFGILISFVHMAWTRAVCGRIKSDYRYSKDIVYNNFPWCSPTGEQKKKIEKTAQGILDARSLYPDSSLADLYDPLTMPKELRKAHTENDKAVMQAYGFSIKDTSEADCVAALMKMYQELIEHKG